MTSSYFALGNRLTLTKAEPDCRSLEGNGNRGGTSSLGGLGHVKIDLGY